MPELNSGLTDLERDILSFERAWWKYAGAKESAIRERFDMSATRYYQVLNALIDRPKALELDSLLVRRLQRLRDARRQVRSSRRLRDYEGVAYSLRSSDPQAAHR